jgi:hypothetical protein
MESAFSKNEPLLDFGGILENGKNRSQVCELIESMVIICVVLSVCFGSRGPTLNALSVAWEGGIYRQSIHSIRNWSRHINGWLIAGKIGGLETEANNILHSRYRKWGLKPRKEDGVYYFKGIARFLSWLIADDRSSFFFPILPSEPSNEARLYAMVEFLIKLGFRLTVDIEVVHPPDTYSELRARVEWIVESTEANSATTEAEPASVSNDPVDEEALSSRRDSGEDESFGDYCSSY